MKERIQQYIDYKGISAGDLATELDVQRSNISHILNGRNKPGATFIEKFLFAFPDLNARWLLTGVGNMLHQGNNITLSSSSKEPIEDEVKNKISSSPFNSDKNHQSEFRKNTTTPARQVTKIILLFSDGTFASYKPNN